MYASEYFLWDWTAAGTGRIETSVNRWHQYGQLHLHKTCESLGRDSRHKKNRAKHGFLVAAFFFSGGLCFLEASTSLASHLREVSWLSVSYKNLMALLRGPVTKQLNGVHE